MITAPINHICLDERGVAYIAGTRIKVRHVAAIERQARGASVEDIQSAFPQLSPGQIYAALAYYSDHQEQIDTEITEAAQFVEAMRAQNPNPLSREQLQARRTESITSRCDPASFPQR
jgi:uncharacterized protein (DUF433 family)